MFAARKVAPALLQSTGSRLASAAAAPTKDKYKVVVLGGGRLEVLIYVWCV